MNAASKRERPFDDVPAVPETSLSISELGPEGTGPVELEIGFGKGHFLLDRAEVKTDTRFIGLETRRKWVHLVTFRAVRREIANVRIWLGDARQALTRLSEDGCLSRIFVNFPDPWWKARHEKRMVVTPELIVQAARLLDDGGELFVQTDVDFRAGVYLETISAHSDFKPVEGNGQIQTNPFGARSLREKKCEEIGLPIYRMLFRRVDR